MRGTAAGDSGTIPPQTLGTNELSRLQNVVRRQPLPRALVVAKLCA